MIDDLILSMNKYHRDACRTLVELHAEILVFKDQEKMLLKALKLSKKMIDNGPWDVLWFKHRHELDQIYKDLKL